MSSSNSGRKPLGSTPISDVVPGAQNLVVLDHTASIDDGLTRLAQYGIQSAPVYNRLTNQFLGSVDVMDMVAFVVGAASGVKSGMDFGDAMKQQFRRPVYDIMNVSDADPFLPVPAQSALAEVLHLFYSQGIHRLPLVDSQNNLVGIVSQWDIVAFLQRNGDRPALVKQMNKTLAELDLAPGNVISVSHRATLKDCFTAIMGYKVSGVAVVDELGYLVGTVSASDLKGVTQENFVTLTMSVADFIRARHKGGALSCYKEATLRQVTDVIARTGLHRVFVVDAANKPISVVSLTDILQVISKHLPVLH
jgi:CBS-domain-containing membrane protein